MRGLSQPPGTFVVAAIKPAPGVLSTASHQRLGELTGEEQVAEQLAARGALTGVERPTQQGDAGRSRLVQKARVMLPINTRGDRPDLAGLLRGDEDERNRLAR